MLNIDLDRFNATGGRMIGGEGGITCGDPTEGVASIIQTPVRVAHFQR